MFLANHHQTFLKHYYTTIDVLYHHRASVWGVKITDENVVTGSMDGTIAVIDANSREVKRHFLAHEDEWGGEQFLKSKFFIVIAN